MPDDVPLQWARSQRWLHWWTAALIGVVFPLGWLMVWVPIRDLLLKFFLYQIHKTLGILVFSFAVTRLLVRATRRRPAWDTRLPGWQRRAAALVHWLLYACLLVTPALGYLTAATASAQIPTLFLLVLPVPHLLGPDPALFMILRPLHSGAAVLLTVLASGHAAAAIHNHLRGRETLVRMRRGGGCRRGGGGNKGGVVSE